jgi:hypothetical protein
MVANIKIDFTEMVYEGADWFQVAQNRALFWIFVETLVNINI